MSLWHWFAAGVAGDVMYENARSSGDTGTFIPVLGALVGAALPWYFNYWGSNPSWGWTWWQCLLAMPIGSAIGVWLAPIVFLALVVYLGCTFCT